MKSLVKFLILILFFAFSQNSNAQFFKKLVEKTNKKIEKEAEVRTEKRIDKVFDGVEDEIDGKNKKSSEKEKDSTAVNQDSSSQKNINNKVALEENNQPTVVWNKFDFIPGDTVIFEDIPSDDEENGEFPSRWDLVGGSAEIAEVDGELVIMFIDGGKIIPYLKNASEDYLPEIFTIEFDVWFEKRQSTANRYFISFKDTKNQQRSSDFNERLVVYPNGLEFINTDKRYPGTETNGWSEEPIGQWRHISIAYTKGKFKVYMNDTRLINIPHLEKNPTGLTFSGINDKMYLKNFRIAKGGVKYYDRVLSEGKIIVSGIKFDINKATLKPESMGPINKIYKLMIKNTDINFSVEGHTDSDGNTETNMTLSKARGKVVMNKLIELGIDASRLKSTGFGEGKPLDNNSTAEGKANNRRVEFVKF